MALLLSSAPKLDSYIDSNAIDSIYAFSSMPLSNNVQIFLNRNDQVQAITVPEKGGFSQVVDFSFSTSTSSIPSLDSLQNIVSTSASRFPSLAVVYHSALRNDGVGRWTSFHSSTLECTRCLESFSAGSSSRVIDRLRATNWESPKDRLVF